MTLTYFGNTACPIASVVPNVIAPAAIVRTVRPMAAPASHGGGGGPCGGSAEARDLCNAIFYLHVQNKGTRRPGSTVELFSFSRIRR
jgi:hypothetical protein